MSLLDDIEYWKKRTFAHEAELAAQPYYRWGTVTRIAPLEVRIDLQTDSIPPSTVVGGLTIGDRVLVLHHNRRATIIGRAGG